MLRTLALLVLIATAARAQTYSLFHPTPRDQARPMATDRPTYTDCPVTVPAGWMQLEIGAVTYTRDVDHNQRYQQLTIAYSSIKLGLLNDLDLELNGAPYVWQSQSNRSTGASSSAEGTTNLTTRLKWNLWGNDGGTTSAAVIPYAIWPVGSQTLETRHTQAGLVLPFAAQLRDRWSFTTHAAAALVRNASGPGDEFVFRTSEVLSYAVTDRLSAWEEVFINLPTESPNVTTLGLGLYYQLTPDLSVDASTFIGLDHAAPDLAFAVGFSVRF